MQLLPMNIAKLNRRNANKSPGAQLGFFKYLKIVDLQNYFYGRERQKTDESKPVIYRKSLITE